MKSITYITLNKEQAFEFDDNKKKVKKDLISGEAKIIKRGLYTLVKLLMNNKYYLIK